MRQQVSPGDLACAATAAATAVRARVLALASAACVAAPGREAAARALFLRTAEAAGAGDCAVDGMRVAWALTGCEQLLLGGLLDKLQQQVCRRQPFHMNTSAK